MLCSLTLFAALKNKFPEAKITLVVSPTNYKIDFKEINPFVDNVLVYKKGSLSNIFRFYKELRKTKFQIGIVPSTVKNSNTSHIINFFSGAKLKVGVKSINGKPNKAAMLLNIKSDFNWKNMHQLQQNLEVVKQIGCDLTGKEIKSIKINLSPEDEKFAENYIKENFPDTAKKIIAFHPGAGEKYKKWDTKNFIKLITMIYDKYHCYILFTAGSIDDDSIGELLGSEELKGIESKILTGTTVKQLAAVLGNVKLYITNNTGTLHIAHFAGVHTLALTLSDLVSDWTYKSEGENYISADNINDIPVEDVFKLSCKMIEGK